MDDRQWSAPVVFRPVCCIIKVVEEEGGGEPDDITVYGSTYSITVLSERGVHVTCDSEQRVKRMRVLQEAMKVVPKTLHKYELKRLW